MPTRLTGTVEERYAYLDRIGRHCDVNGGHCINAAVDEFDVVPTGGGAESIIKSCGRHRMNVLASTQFVIKAHRRSCLSGSSELRRLVA